MNTDFKEIMSKRTDEELIKIVTIDRDGYQLLAVEAAENEIKTRNIDTTHVEQLKSDVTTRIEKQKDFDSKKVGSLKRLLHFIIDTIACFLVFSVLFIFVGLFFSTSSQEVIQLMGFILLVTSFFGYYLFMEYKYQKTLAKIITKTKVMRRDGERAELGDIVNRTFCRLIPFDRVSFIFTQNGIHDRLSDTTVVRDE